jgi:hypothetical protein
VNALGSASVVLKSIILDAAARPAFLLDANRRDSMGNIDPDYYDNRWIVLPQDLPSAVLLRSRGITDISLIQRGTSVPSEDLTHVLLRWQQGGLRLHSIDLATTRGTEDLVVAAPSSFRRAWYAAIAILGLRRSNVGGFGSMVPEQTGRAGFYG